MEELSNWTIKVTIQKLENYLLTGYEMVYIGDGESTSRLLSNKRKEEIKEQINQLKNRLL